MCGIVAAVGNKNIVPVLIEGLKKLEYRGYDSAGIAVIVSDEIERIRAVGRVAELEAAATSTQALTGIAHTRWATHGVPSERNAHPHISGSIAVVHNGIIENYESLRAQLQARGYQFASQTDTEVIAHLVDSLYDGDLFAAMRAAAQQLQGAFAIAVMHRDEPQRVVGARAGSPLVLGVGAGGAEHFLASDAMALAGVTDQIIYLEEGDLVPAARALLDHPGRWPAAARQRAPDPHGASAYRRCRAGAVSALHAKGNLRAAACHCRHPGGRASHRARAV